MINFIIWPIAGAAVGALITYIIRRRNPILLINIIVGCIGTLVAGYLFTPFFGVNTTSFSLPGLLISLGIGILLLLVVNFSFREHTVTNTTIKNQWNQVREKIHARWGRINEKDIDQINGEHGRFLDLIVARYGIAINEAEDQLQHYLKAVIFKH